MPERENGFTPENEGETYDITTQYLNSSRSELREYIDTLPEGAKIELNIDVMDVDPAWIRQFLTQHETAKVRIRATQEDIDLYKSDFPPTVEWLVEQK